MRLRLPLLLLLLAVAALVSTWEPPGQAPGKAPEAPGAPATASQPGLPPEAVDTLQLIQRGGPFPHRQDGTVFQNREGLLPQRPRGYYREYTVRTPGLSHRGARRIVTGGNPPEVYYYTEDHYRSFRRLEVAP